MRSELIQCTSTNRVSLVRKRKKPKKYFFVWSTKQINVLSRYLVDMKTANWIFFVIGQMHTCALYLYLYLPHWPLSSSFLHIITESLSISCHNTLPRSTTSQTISRIEAFFFLITHTHTHTQYSLNKESPPSSLTSRPKSKRYFYFLLFFFYWFNIV